MDEFVVKYYRRLCQKGFEHAGSLEKPSIFLNDLGKKIGLCATISNTYLHIFINLRNNIIDDIKYLCVCNPTTNVVVEILCSLIKGKTIKEAESLTEESFSHALGSKGEEFLKKARLIVEFLHGGLEQYKRRNL